MHFPNEPAEYRAARDRLLEAEIELRRQGEAAAAMRRALPLGGTVPQDYVFEGAGGDIRVSELFGDHDTLVVYSFMFARHLAQVVALAAVAKAPLPRILEYAEYEPSA
jgi:predicted dithiol-disulfide oxidoreductase (DUF899 family)